MVKNMPAIWETQVRSLDWEDPLEEGMATHSSILAWRIPWTEEPGGLQSMGSHRVRHDWATNTFTLQSFTYFTNLTLLISFISLITWKNLSQSPSLQEWAHQAFHEHCQFSSVTQLCPTLCNPMDCSTPRLPVYPNLCPSSQWCHPTISSVVPFSSHLQSFPASGSFQMSQFFTSGGQSIGVSASASVLPMNIQDWFPLGLTGWISLQSKGLSRVFFNTPV